MTVSRRVLFAALVAVLALTGPVRGIDPGAASTPSAVSAAADAYVVPEGIRLEGRFDLSDPAGPRFSYPGTSIHARFTGPKISVTLKTTRKIRFFTSVDGTESELETPSTAGAHTFVLATGLSSSGQHRVVVYRQWRDFRSDVQFRGFSFPDGGGLGQTPAAPSHRMMVIGDSISVGFGIDGHTPCDPLENERHRRTYGAILARRYDAQLHTIARPGIGMYWNANGVTADEGDADNLTAPELYDVNLTGAGTPWDHSAYVPQVVVINLGTNDYNGWEAKGGNPDIVGPSYVGEYKRFIRKIKGEYPNAYVFLVQSPMMNATRRADQLTRFNTIVSDLAAAGYGRLFKVPTDPQRQPTGCKNHPDIRTHQDMADTIAEKIDAHVTSW